MARGLAATYVLKLPKARLRRERLGNSGQKIFRKARGVLGIVTEPSIEIILPKIAALMFARVGMNSRAKSSAGCVGRTIPSSQDILEDTGKDC